MSISRRNFLSRRGYRLFSLCDRQFPAWGTGAKFSGEHQRENITDAKFVRDVFFSLPNSGSGD